MDYSILKHFHVICAALPGMLFVLRGAWMLGASAMRQRYWVRIAALARN